MPAARYWRLVGVEPLGGDDLTVSELRLYSGASPVPGSPALGCTVPPVAGDVTCLQDGATDVAARWSGASVRSPGFAFVWDFGTAVEASELRIGSGPEQRHFMGSCMLQCSSDGVTWTMVTAMGQFLFPGPNQLTPVPTSVAAGDRDSDRVAALLRFDGTFTDETARAWTAAGGAALSTSIKRFGSGSGSFFGGYLTTPISNDFIFGTGDFTLEAWVYCGAPPGGGNSNDRLIFGSFSFSPAAVFFLTNGGNFPSLWDGSVQRDSSIAVPTNQWSHVAYSRTGGTLRIFVDGAVGLSVAHAVNWTGSTAPPYVGSNGGDRKLNGYLDELRITKGVGRYAQPFSPPAQPFPSSIWSTDAGGTVLGPRQTLVRRSVSSVSAAAPASSAHRVLASRANIARDVEFGGRGRVRGTTELHTDSGDVPIGPRRVRLYRMRDGLVVREQWSDAATGVYDFRYVDESAEYYVTAFDFTRDKQAVSADNLTVAGGGVELMP